MSSLFDEPESLEPEVVIDEPVQDRHKLGDYSERFGKKVRDTREARGMPLRRLAAQTGIGPSHLSKIERGVFPPPGEERMLKLAAVLEINPDEMLAAGGRVAADLIQIILVRPTAMAKLLRVAGGLTPEALNALITESQANEPHDD